MEADMRSKRTVYSTVYELTILWGKKPEDWGIPEFEDSEVRDTEEVRLHFSDEKGSWVIQRRVEAYPEGVRACATGRGKTSFEWEDVGELHKNDIPSEEQVNRI
jgi:hypothetical protein